MQTIIHRLTLILFLSLTFTLPAFSTLPTHGNITPSAAKALYNPGLNTVAGNPNGSVTLVELFDYNCPSCRKIQPVIEMMIKRNPDLRVVYKEYPLFGDVSLPPTKAVLAAQKQGKYLSLHGALLRATRPLTEAEVVRIAKVQGLDTKQLKKDMKSTEVLQQINANNALIQKLGLTGAPVIIVSNSNIAKEPKKYIKQPQYVRMGFDDAVKDIQTLIDKVKEG